MRLRHILVDRPRGGPEGDAGSGRVRSESRLIGLCAMTCGELIDGGVVLGEYACVYPVAQLGSRCRSGDACWFCSELYISLR